MSFIWLQLSCNCLKIVIFGALDVSISREFQTWPNTTSQTWWQQASHKTFRWNTFWSREQFQKHCLCNSNCQVRSLYHLRLLCQTYSVPMLGTPSNLVPLIPETKITFLFVTTIQSCWIFLSQWTRHLKVEPKLVLYYLILLG